MANFIILHQRADTNGHGSNPCQHFNLQSVFGLGTEYATQGQTQVGQPTRWEAVGIGGAVNVGDYILLRSGPQSGEFRKVTAIVSANRITLASAWSLDQIPQDFAIVKVKAESGRTMDLREIESDRSDLPELFEAAVLAIRKALTAGGNPTRSQMIASINSSPVELKAVQ